MLRKVWLGVWWLASASLAFGQLDSNSLTILASRTMDLQPDQVVFSVSLTAPMEANLDDVLAALQGSGITADNLDDVNTAQRLLQWTFTLPVPISKIKNTIATFTSLQQSIGRRGPAFALRFSVQDMQVSSELRQSQPCSISDLMADARAQAQKLVTTAGLFLGPVVALSDGDYASSGFLGDLLIIPGTAFRLSPFTHAQVNCSIVVKFSLIHFQ